MRLLTATLAAACACARTGPEGPVGDTGAPGGEGGAGAALDPGSASARAWVECADRLVRLGPEGERGRAGADGRGGVRVLDASGSEIGWLAWVSFPSRERRMVVTDANGMRMALSTATGELLPWFDVYYSLPECQGEAYALATPLPWVLKTASGAQAPASRVVQEVPVVSRWQPASPTGPDPGGGSCQAASGTRLVLALAPYPAPSAVPPFTLR